MREWFRTKSGSPGWLLTLACADLLVVALICYQLAHQFLFGAIADFLNDLSVGLVGTVIAAIALTAPFTRYQEQSRKRREHIALRRLTRILQNHHSVLQGMYLEATPAARQKTFADLRTFFDADFFANVRALNMGSDSFFGRRDGARGHQPWIYAISDEAEQTRRALAELQKQFDQDLPEGLSGALQALLDHDYLGAVAVGRHIWDTKGGGEFNILDMENFFHHFRAHIDKLLALENQLRACDRSVDGSHWRESWRGYVENPLFAPGRSRLPNV